MPSTRTEFEPRTNISGQVVNISGQSIVANVTISGLSTDVSGQIIQVVNASGTCLCADVSGDVVLISGQAVSISGQPVAVTVSLSGASLTASVSGQPVTVSGDIVQVVNAPDTCLCANISGDVVLISGQAVSVSGQTVIAEISGLNVSVSGSIVQVVNASGQVLNVSVSGLTVNVSGAIVEISGQEVSTSISGQAVTTSISGDIVKVVNASGTCLCVSGTVSIVSGASTTAVLAGNVISSGNSTTVALGSGVIFSGASELVLPYTQVTVETFTDASGELILQFSPDNTNWDHVYTDLIAPNESVSIHTPVCAEFFKLIYVNGPLPQSFLRLQTILKPIPSTAIIKDLDEPLTDDDDVIGTHSVITGKSTTGVTSGQYIDVKVGAAGAIFVVASGVIVYDSGQIISVVNASGTCLCTTSSGNIIQVVNASGQILNVTVSGLTVNVSGAIVEISGQIVGISGQQVEISGQAVTTSVSGNIIQIVNASGQSITSGLSVSVSVSGQPVTVSGNIIQIVNASGQSLISGLSISSNISGQAVTVSGQPVTVSGNYVAIDDSSTFLRFYETASLTAASGEVTLKGGSIDAKSQFAYFASQLLPVTATPGKIVRINLTNFTETSSFFLNSGDNTINASVIDPDNRFGYFAATLPVNKIIKVNLNTLTRMSAVTLAFTSGPITAGVIDTTNNFAYFCTSPALGFGSVAKINLSTLTEVSPALILTSGEKLNSAIIDVSGQVAYFGTATGNPNESIIKVNLATFTQASTISTNSGEQSLNSAVIDTLNQFAYFNTNTNPGMVIKVNLSTFTEASTLVLASGENSTVAATIDISHQLEYIGCTSPSRAARVNLLTFSEINSIALNPTFTGPNTNATLIDPFNGFVYLGTGGSPSGVEKLAATFDPASIPAVTVSGNIVTANVISGTILIETNQLSNIVGASGVPLDNLQGSGNQLLPVVMMGLDPTTTGPAYRVIGTDSDGSIHVVNTSGEFLVISGTVGLISGGFVTANLLSGSNITVVSGSIVSIPPPTTIVVDNLLLVTSASGGTVLLSGVITSVIMTALDFNSGDIYVGGSGGTNFPFSGHGYALRAGKTISMDISRMDTPHLCATVSGDAVTFMGVL